MVRVDLSKIIIDEKSDDQAVVLREHNGDRQVPIMIGMVEATSIQMAISGVKTSRPLTHDLLASVIRSLNIEVDHLLIDDMAEGIFFAKLYLKDAQGEPVVVDCRPSDGIALSVRLGIPLFVDEKIFHQSMKSH